MNAADLITDAMVEAAAKAFANHEYRINGPEMVPYCTCGWTATERYGVAEYNQHVARLILEAAALLIAAKALRDAADAWRAIQRTDDHLLRQWLDARADEIATRDV